MCTEHIITGLFVINYYMPLDETLKTFKQEDVACNLTNIT